MPPVVRAHVEDIRYHNPKRANSYFLDANVLFWMTYIPASTVTIAPRQYQVSEYPRFVKAARGAGASLLRCELVLAEIARLIETARMQLCEQREMKQLKRKEYRHDYKTERSLVCSDIRASWAQVKEIASSIRVTLDDTTSALALTQICECELDVYDSFYLCAIRTYGDCYIVTDDQDYCTIPGALVLTANQSMISAAREQGQLVC